MKALIEKYQLIPHPEGGYFKEIYRSDQRLKSPVTGEKRNAVTHIYFLLLNGQVSKFHKVLHDEIWNFYQGSPIRLLTFDNKQIQDKTIGPGCDEFVSVIKGGLFQAAETTGDYSLVGCTVAPGFDFADFSFLRDEEALAHQFTITHPDLKRFV